MQTFLTHQQSTKLNLLNNYIKDNQALSLKLEPLYIENKGDWSKTVESLKNEKLPAEEIKKLEYAFALSEIAHDNEALVNAFYNLKDANSLKDLALKYDAASIKNLIDVNTIPAQVKGDSPEEKLNNYSKKIIQNIFTKEPSAVLQGMAAKTQLPIPDTKVQQGIETFFKNQPDFNIGSTSILEAIKNPEAFKNIEEGQKELVITNQCRLVKQIRVFFVKLWGVYRG